MIPVSRRTKSSTEVCFFHDISLWKNQKHYISLFSAIQNDHSQVGEAQAFFFGSAVLHVFFFGSAVLRVFFFGSAVLRAFFVAVVGAIGLEVGRLDMMNVESGRGANGCFLVLICED